MGTILTKASWQIFLAFGTQENFLDSYQGNMVRITKFYTSEIKNRLIDMKTVQHVCHHILGTDCESGNMANAQQFCHS